MPITRNIIKEQPLFVKINGFSYLAITRTPGFEKEHVLGICFTSGIINKVGDIITIKRNNLHENIIRVLLKIKRKSKEEDQFKNFISICMGIQKKTTVNNKNFHQKKIISKNRLICKTTIETKKIVKKLLYLKKYQYLRKLTKTTHCSVICNKNMKILSLAEDIGRHNAIDKSIGICLRKKNIYRAKVLLLSSRLSYELVQKASKIKTSIIASVSRPSSLAITLAKILNITLLSLSPDDNIIIYSGKKRMISNI